MGGPLHFQQHKVATNLVFVALFLPHFFMLRQGQFVGLAEKKGRRKYLHSG